MQQVWFTLYWALNVYLLCAVVWALLGWLEMLSPGAARDRTVVSVRRFLDSIIMPYIRLFTFIRQPAGFPLDIRSLAAFVVLLVALKVVQGQL